MIYYNVKVDGEHIDCESVNMTTDWESYCWTLNITLNTLEGWIKCEPGKTVTIMIDYVYYVFIIDSRDRVETAYSWQYSLVGRSPTSVLGEGALPVHKTWLQSMSRSIVAELAGDITVDYGVLNWPIPSGVLEANGETPITIIKRFTDAVDGILYTDAGGNLVLTPKHKKAPVNYDLSDTSLVITSYDDILEISETKTNGPGYNKVEVSSEPISNVTSLTLSLVSKTDVEAIIRADIYPFKEQLSLYHASGPTVTIENYEVNPKIETKTQRVTFVDGVASTEFLVKSITEVVYYHNDLGEVTTEGSALYSTINGNGFATVTYVTEYHTYKVTEPDSNPVLVYTTDT